MRAADIGALRSVSRPTLHPAGDRVVVSVTRPHLDSDSTVGQLFSVPLDGSGSKRITRGFRDTAPEFSPDGQALAFLRSEGGGPAQLHVMPAEGGEPIRLTDRLLGVTELSWSPDSTRIAFVSRDPVEGRYGSTPGISPAGEPARRITGVNYKSNGIGYTNDRRAQVYIVARPPLHGEPLYPGVPRPGEEPIEPVVAHPTIAVTSGDYDHSAVRWVGNRVAFISARHATRDRTLVNQIWSAEPGEEPQALLDPTLKVDTFSVASDDTVYLLAQEVGESGTDFMARTTSLYRVDAGAAVRLTDASLDLGDVGSYLTVDGDRILAQERVAGRRHLVSIDGIGTSTRVSTGDVEVYGQCVAGARTVVTYTTPETAGEVGVIVGSTITPLTDFSAGLQGASVRLPRELTVTGRDGDSVHGWVMLPDGPGPHPTLLMIHGGPFSAYTVSVFDEPQVYADAGYAVVFCNPRGSAGYGEAFGRAVMRRMGTIDSDDVLDFLDGAFEAFPSLNRDRLGILGGSYGGYLTAWIIAHDSRFAAAVVERGYLDPESFVGASDIGWFFPQEYNGTDLEAIRAQSPQAVAGQVRTPTLVIHSEDDLRCPIDQAEKYFATLRLNGVDTEMLIFPGENHELSRSGRPRHRVERFDAIVEWFGRHL